MSLGATIGIIIAMIVAIWVQYDAKKRGKSSSAAFLWGLATIFVLIVALPAWLMTRPKDSTS